MIACILSYDYRYGGEAMRFVHIADVHIGMSFKSASFAKSFGKAKRDAIMENFKRLVDYIKDNEIDLLLIAGDFLESDYVEMKDLFDLNYLLKKIPDTHVLMMTGNHDPQSLENNVYTKVEWSENVFVFPAEYASLDIEGLEVSVISVSWDSKGPMKLDREKLEEVIERAGYDRKILMLHGDAYNENVYMPLDPDYLNRLDVDYVALGHIHKMDRLGDKVVYSGSLEGLDFSESYPHGFIEGSIDSQGKLDIEFVESMVYPMEVISIDISDVESMMALKDDIKNAVSSLTGPRSPMLRLVLLGEKHIQMGDFNQDFLEDIRRLLSDDSAYVEIKDKTVPGYDLEELKKEHEDDLIGYFIRSMEEKGLDTSVNQEALSTGISLLLEALG